MGLNTGITISINNQDLSSPGGTSPRYCTRIDLNDMESDLHDFLHAELPNALLHVNLAMIGDVQKDDEIFIEFDLRKPMLQNHTYTELDIALSKFALLYLPVDSIKYWFFP